MSAESDFLPSIIAFMNDDRAYGTLSQYSQGSYDPTTSTYSTVEVKTTCQVLIQDLTRNSNGLSSIYGKLILAGDKDCYLLPPNKANCRSRAITFDTTNDRITIAGVVYKIEDMKEANPTGANAILYQLMLRRQ